MTHGLEVPEKFNRWVSIVQDHGFIDFLASEDGFNRNLRTGKNWGSEQPGIYCWIAENGEAYVGQSLRPRHRLRNHWKTHRDIAYACFQPVPKHQLDGVEQRLIQAIGNHFPTRNITHAFESMARVPFDNFVSREVREAFLKGDALEPNVSWREFPVLTQKQAGRYERMRIGNSYDLVLSSLRVYLQQCVPDLAATEVRFWSVSLLARQVVRVNAGQQEILTIDFSGTRAPWLRLLGPRPLSLDAEGPVYASDSYVSELAADRLADWLTIKRVMAIRELVVRLMRHTTALNSNSHCPQLVRSAFRVSLPEPTVVPLFRRLFHHA